MEEKKFLIGLGILLTLGLAGPLNTYGDLGDILECGSAVSKCVEDGSRCVRKAKEILNKCDNQYNKRLQHCDKYQQKANQICTSSTDPSLPCSAPKCQRKYEKCNLKAQRSKDPSTYKARCDERLKDCTEKAKDKSDRLLSKQAECKQTAEDRKNACNSRTLEKIANRTKICLDELSNCCKRLEDKCGSTFISNACKLGE
jgi:hypothetical protein